MKKILGLILVGVLALTLATVSGGDNKAIAGIRPPGIIFTLGR